LNFLARRPRPVVQFHEGQSLIGLFNPDRSTPLSGNVFRSRALLPLELTTSQQQRLFTHALCVGGLSRWSFRYWYGAGRLSLHVASYPYRGKILRFTNADHGRNDATPASEIAMKADPDSDPTNIPPAA
jgi:hypothetical protein